jgi:hypothetical protein
MLRRYDPGAGIFDCLLADLDVVLGGSGIVAGGFDVNQGLVDVLFLCLNRRTQLLQTLIGRSDIGYQRGQRVRVGTRLGRREPRCAQQHCHAQYRRSDRASQPGDESKR